MRELTLTVNGQSYTRAGRAAPAVERLSAPRAGADRHACRLRARRLRGLYRAARWRAGALVPDCSPCRRTATRSPRSRGWPPTPSICTRLQQAFWEAHGLQCGFCTPGFLMTLLPFLDENPDPSEDEIRDALSRQPLPLHRLPEHRRRRAAGRASGGSRGRRGEPKQNPDEGDCDPTPGRLRDTAEAMGDRAHVWRARQAQRRSPPADRAGAVCGRCAFARHAARRVQAQRLRPCAASSAWMWRRRGPCRAWWRSIPPPTWATSGSRRRCWCRRRRRSISCSTSARRANWRGTRCAMWASRWSMVVAESRYLAEDAADAIDGGV